MSYYINLQKSIDYIEDNLERHVELEQIAKCAGYSIPHFYRVFGAIVGLSVKEYVRKRKLSEAVMDLVSTNQSITSIAFKYGYESNEVFTRAFMSIYGISPSKFRKSNLEPSLLMKVNLLIKDKESRERFIQPKIVYKDQICLWGIVRKINQSDNIKYELLENVKNELMEMLKIIEERIRTEIYYAVYEYNPIDICKQDDEINYMYYYCIEALKSNQIPKGMIRIVIPQAKYAFFSFDKNNNTLNGEKLSQPVYNYIDGIWLPNSGYELSETVDYEVLDNINNRIDYYISIK